VFELLVPEDSTISPKGLAAMSTGEGEVKVVGGGDFYPKVALRDRMHAAEPYWRAKLSQPSKLQRFLARIQRALKRGERK
jgi:hypothetical protein